MRWSPSLAVCIRPSSIAFLFAAAVSAQEVLDQSYLPAALTNGLEITASQSVTQTFTAGVTGLLTRVELARMNHNRGTPTQPLIVKVVTTTGGVPTTTALATVTLQPASTPASIGPLQIDLTAFGIQVVQGQQYGLALSTAAAGGTQTYGWWGEAPSTGYAGGQVFIGGTTSLSVWDLAFETWVALPASSTSYGVGHPGTLGTPTLLANAPPRLGTAPQLQLGNTSGSSTFGALFFGTARANAPTPFGGTALVQSTGSVSFALPIAGGSIPFAIPPVPAFAGLLIDVQGVVIDAGASQGIAFSPGLELRIGG